LLYAVILSLLFTGIRMVYSVVAILSSSKSLNPITGDIGYRVGLSFIPELIVIIILVHIGMATLNLRRDVKNDVGRQKQSHYGRRNSPSTLEGGA
jgi:hypothetical protein